MRETDTQVKWPSKLKIGAKSKKGDGPLSHSSCGHWCCPEIRSNAFNFHIDPHVKVEGRRDNVVEAKKKILEILETKVSVLARGFSQQLCSNTEKH